MEEGDSETIKIKIPSIGIKEVTNNMRRNPWMVSTFVLGVFVLVLFIGSFFESPSGISGMVSASEAGNNLVNFLSQNINSTLNIQNISIENGLYKVEVEYQGSLIPLYVTLDGKYFVQTPISLDSQTPSGEGQASASLKVPDFVPYLGSANAKLDIVEFGDYQCPFCEKFFSEAEPQIIKNYVDTGKARFYFLDFAFLGADSNTLSEGAWCANEQDKYYAYHDYIYSNQGLEHSGWGTPDKVKAMAKNIKGLDAQKFSSCLDSGKYVSRVQQLTQLGQSAGISGTPGFVIMKQGSEGISLSGALPFSAFQQAIENELSG